MSSQVRINAILKELFSVVCSGCLDTLAAMQELKMGVASAEEETQAVMKVYSKEDYSVVNRFESKWALHPYLIRDDGRCR